jgi:hypothetical protein
MSPHTRLLFFVVTSDSEKSAYLNELGGAIMTRSRREALSDTALPTLPMASIR